MARTLQGDIRSKILDAASDRMAYYGFKKTTIDEVAADAGVGKGTVYLYFESKEDIALAILARVKESNIARMLEIAQDSEKRLSEKLAEMLSFPILRATEMCRRNPGSVEMILSVRPHMQMRMRPYIEQETAVIADVLEQGNRDGTLDVPDTVRTARSLKFMVAGFWPPYPCAAPEDVAEEIAFIVEQAIRGLRKGASVSQIS
ncbi:MAG: TetR/AcrR family transcriptional regulator [Capsulimonadaceae bacterium]